MQVEQIKAYLLLFFEIYYYINQLCYYQNNYNKIKTCK
jgi:hypothetical protein